jgi:hypothetical protein
MCTIRYRRAIEVERLPCGPDLGGNGSEQLTAEHKNSSITRMIAAFTSWLKSDASFFFAAETPLACVLLY